MRRLSRRGIALILALFTTAILIILSVSFLVLALGESRNSRTAGYEGAAVQAANFGIGYVINLMGRGGAVAGQTLWVSENNLDGLGTFNVLRAPLTVPHQSRFARIAVSPDFPAAAHARRVTMVNGAGVPWLEPLGVDQSFTVSVDVIPLTTRGITSYQLISTAEVWAVPQGQTPLARRRIEVRVLEEGAASYLHFVSNARSTNVQGQTSGEVPNDVAIPNSIGNIVQQRHQVLAGNVRIPPGYVENGPMRIDGQRYAGAGQVNATNLFAQASGNVVFGPGTRETGQKPRFDEQLVINGLGNGYEAAMGVLDPNQADTESGFFPGGIQVGSAQLGLPDFAKAKTTLRQAAQVATQTGSQNGLIEVPTNALLQGAQFQGRTTYVSSNPGNPPTDELAYVGNPFVERMEVRNGIKVPIEPDYRPRFPNTELSFNNDEVTITNVSTLNGQPLNASKTFKLNAFEKGVIYVEGGNAVVTGGRNVTGQITVATSERTDDPVGRVNGRERPNATVVDAPIALANGTTSSTYNATFHNAYNTTTVSNETLYSYAARQATEYNRSKAQEIAAGPPIVDGQDRQQRYAQLKTPPYSVADLQAYRTAGIVTADVPSANVNRRFFPPPSSALTPKVEREGNLIMAGDFEYNPADRATSVGFLAQNFVLFNDRDVNNDHKLKINGVLMSGERSVQLDWDNTGRQPATSHQALITPGYNGTIQLKGSIVGEYIDVEGDYEKRGYFNQQFEHDRQLNYQRPPYFPKWDFASLPGGFRFVMTHYVDRGSLSTEGEAPSLTASPSP